MILFFRWEKKIENKVVRIKNEEKYEGSILYKTNFFKAQIVLENKD